MDFITDIIANMTLNRCCQGVGSTNMSYQNHFLLQYLSMFWKQLPQASFVSVFLVLHIYLVLVTYININYSKVPVQTVLLFIPDACNIHHMWKDLSPDEFKVIGSLLKASLFRTVKIGRAPMVRLLILLIWSRCWFGWSRRLAAYSELATFLQSHFKQNTGAYFLRVWLVFLWNQVSIYNYLFLF